MAFSLRSFGKSRETCPYRANCDVSLHVLPVLPHQQIVLTLAEMFPFTFHFLQLTSSLQLTPRPPPWRQVGDIGRRGNVDLHRLPEAPPTPGRTAPLRCSGDLLEDAFG